PPVVQAEGIVQVDTPRDLDGRTEPGSRGNAPHRSWSRSGELALPGARSQSVEEFEIWRSQVRRAIASISNETHPPEVGRLQGKLLCWCGGSQLLVIRVAKKPIARRIRRSTCEQRTSTRLRSACVER